jgi:3-oxoacyl-[acyl-carrier protein] reductase
VPRPRMRAVVTGASQGIGRAAARRLAVNGFDIAIHYRSHAAEAEDLAQEIGRGGQQAFAVPGDLSDPAEMERLAESIRRRWDSVDVLVHNAGDYPRQPFEATTSAEFERLYRVHVESPAALTRALLPELRRSSAGRVIFVSSVLAYIGSTRGAPYSAAKAAQLGLARSLMRELAPAITVNVVAPGSIDTAVLAADTPKRRQERIRQIPAGRIGHPADVAAAIAFLASPEAGFINGITLHVNGGQHPG